MARQLPYFTVVVWYYIAWHSNPLAFIIPLLLTLAENGETYFWWKRTSSIIPRGETSYQVLLSAMYLAETCTYLCTLLSRIIVPGRLFFFGIFFHPGCLIRDSPLIKITKFYPGRMPNRYSPFIFFKDF